MTVWIAATDEPVAFRAAVRPVEEQDSLFFTDASSLAGYFASLRRRSFDPAAPKPPIAPRVEARAVGPSLTKTRKPG